jgi:hypothetical protein
MCLDLEDALFIMKETGKMVGVDHHLGDELTLEFWTSCMCLDVVMSAILSFVHTTLVCLLGGKFLPILYCVDMLHSQEADGAMRQ